MWEGRSREEWWKFSTLVTAYYNSQPGVKKQIGDDQVNPWRMRGGPPPSRRRRKETDDG